MLRQDVTFPCGWHLHAQINNKRKFVNIFLSISLKESATYEKTWTVFVQDVSHNINLMRIGKWRRLNRISLRLNIPTQRFLYAWERRHSFWFGSRFCKRFTWSAGARIPDVTSLTLILCVLRMCEKHCLCESDYIGVYTLLLFVSIIGLYIE